jgi:hypothetical protein
VPCAAPSSGLAAATSERYDRATMSLPGPVTHVPRRQRGGVVLWLLTALAVLVLLGAGYVLLVLNWSYSEGERSGVLQKFSKKGWLIKTWEGELAMTTVPGVAPVIWNFTVRDDAAAQQVSASLGRSVVVHYTEHRGLPGTLFGETQHFVDGVRITGEGAAAAAPEL